MSGAQVGELCVSEASDCLTGQKEAEGDTHVLVCGFMRYSSCDSMPFWREMDSAQRALYQNKPYPAEADVISLFIRPMRCFLKGCSSVIEGAVASEELEQAGVCEEVADLADGYHWTASCCG